MAKGPGAEGDVRGRQFKERLVLSQLRRVGEASTRELALAAGLPVQTTVDLIAGLEADKLIYRHRKRLGQVGQPSILYAIAPDGVFALGLHVQRMRQELALVDFNGRIRQRVLAEGHLPKFADVLEFLKRGLAQFVSSGTPRGRISGIGVSLSHDFWYRSERQALPPEILADWDAHSISVEMRASLGLPVFVENDTRVAAIAEYLLGIGQDFRNFLYVSIGQHISGALILGGSLETGAHGNAAMLGAIPVGPSRLARTNSSGSGAEREGEFLGDRASLAGLMRHLQLHGFTIHAVSELPEAIDQARGLVQEWLEDCVAALVEGLTAGFAVIDVEAVIIDSLLPSYLILEIVEKLEQRLKRSRAPGLTIPAIRLSQLSSDAALIGSAVLPIYEHFSPRNGFAEGDASEQAAPSRRPRRKTRIRPADG